MELRKHLATRLSAFVAVGLLTLLSAVPANAQPEGQPVGAESPTLSLNLLGMDPDLAFYGQVGVATLTVPVPAGMVPSTLNVFAQLPVNVRTATVTVSQDDRVIARVDVPPGGPAPLVIPLAGARVEDNAVTVLLRSYLMPDEGYCLDPTNPLRLTDATVSFAGVELPPTAVADFLPPVLRKLTIYLDREPSQIESDAAVQLATAVAAHYGKQYPRIEVVPTADPAVPPPGNSPALERHIIISEGPDSAVSLYGDGPGIPALLIAGPANDLNNQTRLVTSNVSRYALTSRAVVGPLKSTPQLPGNVTTLRQLGQPGVNATALSPQVVIGLDQTRLGRSVHGVRMHLQGSYTPLPRDIGAQLVATIGAETIDRWPADAGGVINRWIDVPDRLLHRYTGVAVQLNISGNTGRCGEFQPITLTIDGESVVQTSAAHPPVPAGFQSLPQALMPRVQIGIGDDIYADTVRAVAIMTGLQRLSALPIDTAVVPLAVAIDSPNPAVLISPRAWADLDIRLPVLAPETVPTTLDVVDDNGNATTLTLYPDLRFGSLQTVYDGRRTLLVATSNGAPAQLDELLTWLSADERRWSIVDGVALLAVAGRDPVTVAAPDVTVPVPVDDDQTNTTLLWWFGGALLGAVAIGAAWILRGTRRRPGG